MKQKFYSFLQDIPNSSKEEIFETIAKNESVRIERIISYGQVSPKDFWYDQDEDEFVIILDGNAEIEYDDGTKYKLSKGDSLYIDAHQKHKVVYTSNPAVWLAIFLAK
ncbi:cupin domain-containing protein [Sulfurimonas sp.]|uniref:cupin domain-containing protein n=1 Tax=Sulfurimonas sp. TaxID=2022749 RepID=UPI0035682EF7